MIAIEGSYKRGGISKVEPPYRPDVDGLRAIAISSVIAFHITQAWIPGGFIGVDVFFVISGFLILRIIVGGLEQGAFSLTGFYARRVRRILPALIIVLVFVWAFGWKYILPEDFAELCRQILASAAFASNFLNFSEAGYFDAPAATKPLLQRDLHFGNESALELWDGCLARVGDMPGDIIQFDDNHSSKAGSLYFVNHIVGEILRE